MRRCAHKNSIKNVNLKIKIKFYISKISSPRYFTKQELTIGKKNA